MEMPGWGRGSDRLPSKYYFDGRHPKLRTPLALVGVKEMIVVLTDDVCLLAEKSQDQKIKAMVQTLARSSSTRHLVE